MFKDYNKDTRTISMTSFWCLYCWLWTYFTSFSSVSIIDLERVNVCWSNNAVFTLKTFQIERNFCQLIWLKFLSIKFLCSLRGLYNPLRKTCPYSELLWSVFSRIWTEYGQIRSISLYSVQIRENTDQNNSENGHFSRSDCHNGALHWKKYVGRYLSIDICLSVSCS